MRLPCASCLVLLLFTACSESDVPSDAAMDSASDSARDAPSDADSAAEADSEADALPPGVVPSPDGEGYCCPIGVPSCDCTPTGGFVSLPNRCIDWGVCDGHPSDWVLSTDAHGCETYTVGTATCCACSPDAAFDIRIDFGNWAADPTGNWVLMPLGTMNTLFEGLVDFATGMATPVSFNSDAEWISSGGDASNWAAGDVAWLPEIVAQDAWGGNVVGNTVRFEGVPGAVRVDVVAASGFPRDDMSIEVNGVPTTTTFRGRSDVDSAAWNAETDGTDMADWAVWRRVEPVDGIIDIHLTPGLLSAIRLSPPE